MGNYRFRLSDMIPNAWFYKLKDMGKGRNGHNNAMKKKKQPLSTATTTQPSKLKQPHHHSYPRKSYYFTREFIPIDRFHNSPSKPKATHTHFPDPPRRSSRQRIKRRSTSRPSPKVVTSSVCAGCSRRETLWTDKSGSSEYSASPSDSSPDPELSENFPPELRSDRALPTESFDNMVAWSSSCSCGVNSKANDIVIDVEKKSLTTKFNKLDGFDSVSDLDLPPIITKPTKLNDDNDDTKKKDTKQPTRYRRSSEKFEERNAYGSLSVKLVKEESITVKEHKTSPGRRLSANSPGVRLRVNSPRIANRRIQGRKSVSSSSSSSSRRSLSDSLAIVKSSFDPQRDFRDSMVEMIVENNIRASKDLEELLACYLSLNADEYHDLIIKVFKQIWFDLSDIKLK